MQSEGALQSIRLEAGNHFDPAVCEAFLRSRERIEEIRETLSDDSHCAVGPSVWTEFSDVPLASDSLLAAVPINAP